MVQPMAYYPPAATRVLAAMPAGAEFVHIDIPTPILAAWRRKFFEGRSRSLERMIA